jgi:hypothetical protein
VIERWINLVEAADVKVPNQTIKEPRVSRQQRVEPVPEIISRLICHEG